MDAQAIVQILIDNFDLEEVTAWMVESIPETLSDMQEAVQGEMPDNGYTEEQDKLFYDAFWQAIYEANESKEE